MIKLPKDALERIFMEEMPIYVLVQGRESVENKILSRLRDILAKGLIQNQETLDYIRYYD